MATPDLASRADPPSRRLVALTASAPIHRGSHAPCGH